MEIPQYSTVPGSEEVLSMTKQTARNRTRTVRETRGIAKWSRGGQICPRSIPFNTARVRSRTPSFDRIVEM